MSEPLWVATPDALAAAVAAWQHREWLTVDTEFLRVDTYRSKLCLVQVGDGTSAWVVDVLAFDDLAPLFDALLNPAVIKVFHAASQDQEIFAQLTGRCPAPLFDTQIAAALLGLGDQLGYAGLVEKRRGIAVDKSLSRADWSKRPLSAAERAYAAADVTHLADLYPLLRDELQARGRLDWLTEDCARLSDPASYQARPEDAWQRLRGLPRLDAPAQRAVARLAAWREVEAEARNRPRGWIVDDDALYRLAERRPRTLAELASLNALPPKTLERQGSALLAAIAEAQNDPATPLAVDERPNAAQKERINRLRNTVNAHAEALGLPPGLLAPRAELDALLAEGANAPVRVLQGWRRAAVGEALLAAL